MLEQLRKSLADKVGGLDELQTKALADDATADDVKALNDELDAVEDLEKQIATAEKVEAKKAALAKPAKTPTPDAAEKGIISEGEEKSESKFAQYDKSALTPFEKLGIMTASLCRSVQSGGAPDADGMAKQLDQMGYEGLMSDNVVRSMISTTGTAGGFAVDQSFNETIFNELRPYSAFLQGPLDMMPMPTGNYRQSGVDTRGQVGYRGEGTKIAVDQPTLREINMNAKLLGGIVPITNELIKYTGNRAGQKAQETLAVEMGLAMDLAGFEGTGAGSNPLGLFNIAGITTDAAAVGTTPNVASVESQLRPMINIIESFPALQRGVAWIMPQRVIGYLQDLRDDNGNTIFPTMQGMSPSFKGYPVYKAGTITTNGGAGTNETTIALISYSNILFGDTAGLEIMISKEASYTNGGGDQTSAFETNMTLIRATMQHDWTPRYDEAIATLTAVQWGA